MRSLPASAVALALFALACGGADPRRPDVILVVVDTLRADRLSCYGYPRATSPVIDGLAAEGTLFRDATAQSGWTLPSMASLLTGRYVTAQVHSLGADGGTLAEAFQRAGYVTLAHVANLSMTHDAGFARGFSVYDLRPEERGLEAVLRPPRGDNLLERTIASIDEVFPPERKENERAPLFLLFHSFDPHNPYDEHPESPLEPEAAVDVLPEGWQAKALSERGREPPRNDPEWQKTLAKLRRMRGLYDQEVEYSDRIIGELLSALRERGFLEHALVALVSDHGEGLWDHVAGRPPLELAEARPIDFFYQRHGAHLYQEAIHTPFVLWGAGVPAGVVIEEPVENVDLFPTLLELASVPIPPGPAGELHGRSLVGALRTGRAPERSAVFSFVHHKASVREVATGLKLTLVLRPEFAERHANELFHLPSDPHERNDLADSRPEDLARLERTLRDWLERHAMGSGSGSVNEAQAQALRDLGYTADDIGQ